MGFDTAYEAISEETDSGQRWAFGTGFTDPLAGVDTTVPAGIDGADLGAYCLMLGDDALVAPGVEVTRVMQRHRGVRRVQRSDVHVVEPALAAQEDLVQRPVRPRLSPCVLSPCVLSPCPLWLYVLGLGVLGHAATSFAAARAACLAACAAAASRTHAPPSCAACRLAMRCALHGPLPLITRLNSTQSGWPKS